MKNLYLAILLAAIATGQELTLRTEVRLIDVAFTARDASGKLVTDLRKEEIEVLEDGAPQNLEVFLRSGEVPLSLGLTMDASGSQSRFYKQHRKDMRTFLRTVLNKQDRAMVTAFGNYVRLVSDYSSDADRLLDELEEYHDDPGEKPAIGPNIRRDLGTGFYDAIYLTIEEKLKQTNRGRRALLIFSDGEDNASARHLLDAIEAAQRNDVVLFSIHYSTSKASIARNYYGRSVMKRMADDTGGLFVETQGGDLRQVFEQIEGMLRSSYEVAYRSTNTDNDGTFRKIKIRCSRPGITIRHRAGYYTQTAN